MIVDVHTHTPSHVEAVPEADREAFGGWHGGPPVSLANSWQDYVQGTAAADLTIVFNMAGPRYRVALAEPLDDPESNDKTARLVASDPTRRIGFMGVHPLKPDCLDEVERCIELGLAGIKLGANYQVFDPLSEEAFALYAHAERRGLPILFHQGTSPVRQAPIRYAHPLVTDEIAIRHPELRIVMAHLGHPFVREAVVTVRKHPHVYADVSAIYTRPWMLYEGLVMASEWGVLPKLLFGSDFPVTTPQYAMERLRAVNDIVDGTAMPKIAPEAIEAIIHADALSALGLRDPRT